MLLLDILSLERIVVDAEGTIHDKQQALLRLGELLAPGIGEETAHVVQLLTKRESLQSTGIGDGVAIPHASVETARAQTAALLLCPGGVEFDAIDGAPATIIVGIVGPKSATGEHLRVLARVSRFLSRAETRQRLLACERPDDAYRLVVEHDAADGGPRQSPGPTS